MSDREKGNRENKKQENNQTNRKPQNEITQLKTKLTNTKNKKQTKAECKLKGKANKTNTQK